MTRQLQAYHQCCCMEVSSDDKYKIQSGTALAHFLKSFFLLLYGYQSLRFLRLKPLLRRDSSIEEIREEESQPSFFFNESTRPYWISFYYPENRLQLSVNTVFAWPRSSLKYLINNTWCWSEISVIRQGVNCKLSWHFLWKDYPQCVSTSFLSKPEPSFKEFENHIASTF